MAEKSQGYTRVEYATLDEFKKAIVEAARPELKGCRGVCTDTIPRSYNEYQAHIISFNDAVETVVMDTLWWESGE